MDPYLEDPLRWPDVHQGLIGCMRAVLNTILPPGYAANIGERCQIVPTDRSIYPDVLVRKHPGIEAQETSERGGVAVLGMPDAPVVLEELPLEPREVFLEVLNVADGRRVVTTIEVLSPANKTAGGKERERYLRKQQEILESRTHLIEIDLLRAGQSTVAAPVVAWEGRPLYHYLVCLHRGGQGRRFEIWPNRLRERLPCIALPLDEGVPDLSLDLQAVFDRNYDEGAYLYQIDYTAGPVPPLSAEDARWADALLRAKGLRP
jgi:hypothetical protein